MDKFTFYRENYLFEFEIKEKLEKSASTTIAALVILGSIISLFINEIKNIESDFNSIAFIFLLCLSGISFLLALYFIIKALYNYLYMYVPTSSQLKLYHEELVNHYRENEDGKVRADKDWEEYLIQEYAANAHTNFQNNSKKSAFIHLSNSFLIITIIFLILSSVPYFVNNFNKDECQKIENINTIK